MKGVIVYRETIEISGIKELNLNLVQGVYVLKINNEKEFTIKKIVIRQ
ncbi:MAG: T9SS type A sorting domain-containing protein [Dysgonamonadaceae bacterium]|nr:T9SS type A sorting domain-containing protein [Dysgonamonadaceae bacterium]